MEAVRHFFKTIERGQQLVIDLPEGVDKAEVEVIVRPLHEKNIELGSTSSFETAQQFKGSMKNSGYQVDEYDVYDQ